MRMPVLGLQHAVSTDVNSGVGLHGFHLTRELVRIGPIVIPFAQGNIAAPDQGTEEGLRYTDAFGILVFGLIHGTYEIGVS